MKTTRPTTRFPECEKLSRVQTEHDAVVEFLNWLFNQEGCELSTNGVPDRRGPEELAAAHFGLDLKALKREWRVIKRDYPLP